MIISNMQLQIVLLCETENDILGDLDYKNSIIVESFRKSNYLNRSQGRAMQQLPPCRG